MTWSGYRHDVCSAVHPLLLASPFFRRPAFDALRASLRQPEVPVAHPLDGGTAVAAYRSVEETSAALGADGPAYLRLMGPLVREAQALADQVLAPLRTLPGHPLTLARFGIPGLRPVEQLVRRFRSEEAKALLGGLAAHSMQPLSAPLTAGFALLLATTAHAVGWPVVAGGSGAITDALVGELTRLGGTIETGRWVRSLSELPRSTAVVLDTSPRGLLALAGPMSAGRSTRGPPPLPLRAGRVQGRLGPLGTGAVDGRGRPTGRNPASRRHHRRGGRGRGRSAGGPTPPERPYCIVVQPGVADPSRAPDGGHTLWGYGHVPAGSDLDMTGDIEAQIERFAPGFRDLVMARSTRTAADEERHNPNYVGGDIGGGAATLGQTLFRPTRQWNPYRTPIEGVYLCSASTPPGAGVHGMCGVYAARTVLRDHFGGGPPLRP